MKSLHIALLLLAVVLTGCDSQPPFTKVSGTVTKNGQPLNKVSVRFVPLDETLVKYVGTGVTDEEGKFTIAIPGQEGEVCCLGQSKVTLREAPMPGDVRGQLEEDGGRGGIGVLNRYKASLKNRPIPSDYGRLHSTPLTIDVTAEKTDYPIEL